MDDRDPLWLPGDQPSVEVLPARTGWINGGRKRTPEMEALVLDIIGRTGSPGKAAELVGIHPQTIVGWRRRDAEFAAKYREAMNGASELVMGKAFDLALDDLEPSVPIILAMMKFRSERLSMFADVEGEATPTVGGLDANIVQLMEPADRRDLLRLITKYLEVQNARAIASK